MRELFFILLPLVVLRIVLSAPLSTEIFIQRGIYTLLVGLGEFSKRMYTDIDLVIDRTWYSPLHISKIEYEPFTKKGSAIMKIDDVKYSFDITEGNYRITDSRNKDLVLVPFRFLYLNKKIFHSDSISFAYNIKEEFSIIHQLYNKKHITRRAFAFSEKGQENKINFYYGELPQEQTNNKNRLKCKVNQKYSTWGCDIHSLTFSDKKYKPYIKDQYVYFQTNIQSILAPENFIHYLYDTIFKEYSENEQCEYSIDGKEARIICNNSEILQKLPKVYIKFDSGTIVIEEIMRKYYSGRWVCVFEKNYIDNDTDSKWVFGNGFLLLFSEVFDYDRSEITFYSDKYIIPIPYSKLPFILNIIMLIIMIIILQLSKDK